MIKKVFIKLVLYLNIIAALLLILNYISVYINPARFWPAAILGLTYPYILLINFMFLIYWAVTWKKYTFISLIVILIGWKHVNAHYKFGGNSDIKNKGVSVMSYNIQMTEINEQILQDPVKKQIVEIVYTEKPGILCFQEYVSDYRKPYEIPKPINHFYEYRNAVMERSGKNSFYGLTIFSKYQLISKGDIKFDNSPNFCIYGDYIIQNDTVRVYNVHLQSVRFHPQDYQFIDSLALIKNSNRMKQAQLISEKLKDAFIKRAEQVLILKEHISGSPYKVLVCGDFNDTPVSYVYQQLSASLLDSFSEQAKGFGNTYIGKGPSFRIDYIFHDNRITTGWFQRKKIRASDHYPIMAGIYLK